MIPTSRCTIYSRYFYRRLFVQRAPKYQWQRRAVAVDHAWCCAGEKKMKRSGGGGDDGGSESEASERDYRRREERRKNDSCINTARPGVYIYLYVASRCWAFVVPDDGRLSRETTSEAFASSSSSSSRPPSSSRILRLSFFSPVGLRLFLAAESTFLEWISRQTRVSKRREDCLKA